MRIFERRINIKKNSIPSPMDALFVYIIVLIGMIYVGGVLGLKSVLMSVFIPQGLILLVPLLAVIYMKGDIKKIYLLKLPKNKASSWVDSLICWNLVFNKHCWCDSFAILP